jgi:acyl carrier protein
MAPEVEQIVREVFADLLGKPDLAATDDFFVLGGTSLSAAIAVTRLEKQLGATISLRLLMENPRAGDFAAALSRKVLPPEARGHEISHAGATD